LQEHLFSLSLNESNSMGKSFSWEANSRSTSQEISLIFMEPESSVPCSREPATDPHPKPEESSAQNMYYSLIYGNSYNYSV
jgi:hypothetical protein